MKKKMFGNIIAPSCDYCIYSQKKENTQYCTKNKTLINGQCKKFEYNPIMRTPLGAASLPKYKAEDFAI